MFDEYGPEHPDDVPDGTEQRVYWIDGSTVVRDRVAGAWEYSVVDDEYAPTGSVRGGVSSSGVLESVPARGAGPESL